MSRASVFQTTARICASSSLSEKYQWPDEAIFRFETSPSTQTSTNSVSRTPWIRSVSSETVSARRRAGRGAAASPKSRPFWRMRDGHSDMGRPGKSTGRVAAVVEQVERQGLSWKCVVTPRSLALAGRRGVCRREAPMRTRSRLFFLGSLAARRPARPPRLDRPAAGASPSPRPPEAEPAPPPRRGPRPARADLDAEERHTIDLFKDASRSVAFITTQVEQVDFWTRNVIEVPAGTGSGFVWDDRGHVVTNFHVVQDADSAKVTIGDAEYEATIVGFARDQDLAVLRIAGRAARSSCPSGSARAPTSRSARRSTRSATRSASTTRSPPASSARSAARSRA